MPMTPREQVKLPVICLDARLRNRAMGRRGRLDRPDGRRRLRVGLSACTALPPSGRPLRESAVLDGYLMALPASKGAAPKC